MNNEKATDSLRKDDYTEMSRPCDVFISYSQTHKGASDAAEKLHQTLKCFGIESFKYATSLPRAKPWEEKVIPSLKQAKCVIVLIPAKGRLTEYMNHEIGIAEAFGKQMMPLLLTGRFSQEISSTNIVRRYWGASLNDVLGNIGKFVDDLSLRKSALMRRFWTDFLEVDRLIVVHGGYNPARGTTSKASGDHLSLGDVAAIQYLSAFLRREFGADLRKLQIRFAGDICKSDTKDKNIIFIGGPHAYLNTDFEQLNLNSGISFNEKERTYKVKGHVDFEVKDSPPRRAGLVARIKHPCDVNCSALHILGVSGYGAHASMAYLTGDNICPKVVEGLEAWKKRREGVFCFSVDACFDGTVLIENEFNVTIPKRKGDTP